MNEPDAPFTFERVGAALALCTADGRVLQLTPEAGRLFERFGVAASVGSVIEAQLWNLLAEHRLGDQIEWQPAPEQLELLGISRYPAGDAHYLLMMREVSDQRHELAKRLHRQRLEWIGRLIASVSHDLRTVVSSIVYNAEVLDSQGRSLTPGEFSTTIREIAIASQHLSASVDGLLGYARLGPQIAVPVNLAGCIERAIALVRRQYRESQHTVEVDVRNEASQIVGNPILVDQVLVNLLINAAESSTDRVHVSITSRRVGSEVETRIQDDGPGVPQHLQNNLFRPFFSTKAEGSGVGLAVAREAARELRGDLTWVPSQRGACFVLTLPAPTEPDSRDSRQQTDSKKQIYGSANR